MSMAGSRTRQRPIGPYSVRLQRGALGAIADGRSATGRFIRRLEAELTAHCGGSTTITQRLLIDRVIRIRLQLDALDEKLSAGTWTPHDQRTYGGLLNAFRLHMRELGIKSAPERKAPSLSDITTRIAARRTP
jgi:hypothetical protein